MNWTARDGLVPVAFHIRLLPFFAFVTFVSSVVSTRDKLVEGN